jgi:hypothetical protein
MCTLSQQLKDREKPFRCKLCAVACDAGLLASLSASLPAIVQYTQQQLAAGRNAAASWDAPLLNLLSTAMHSPLAAWKCSLVGTPALVPAVVHLLLPLLQQLQSCSPQLLQAAAVPAARSSQLPTGFSAVHEAAAAVVFE